MIRKLTAVMLAIATLSSSAALAAEVGGVMTESGIAILTDDKTRMILNGYDENGRLARSAMFASDNGEFTVPSDFAGYKLRAAFLDGQIYDVGLTADEPIRTDAPASTAAPVQTAAPKPTAEPSRYPDIYEKRLDAIDAIAVVDKVSYGENENSEGYYIINALYQGKEDTIAVEADVTVTSASDEFGYMVGQAMTSLKSGDVICFTANLSGKIKNVGFVYRPIKNIVTDGKDYGSSFEKLISCNGKVAERSDWAVMTYGGGNRTRSSLAFGVISDKTANSVTLLGPDGNAGASITADIKKDTIVYVCDMSAKNRLSVEETGGISKSSIPRSAEDEQGNVTYGDGQNINYALLRVVEGIVTDAVIYTNYN